MTKSGTGEIVALRSLLSDWFARERRDLPWRRTTDPYAIWVSEIMLQQTRVAAVIDRYPEFLRRFPSVQALADAPESDVLAAWSGLGYYRRARMLHRGARQVCAQHGGRLPTGFAELLTLPGVGRYTAAAIASIAFCEPVAAVDGNVERVVLRLRGWSLNPERKQGSLPRRLQAEADRLLDPTAPGDWNQAMMELGATVCLPRGPLCARCPWLAQCATRGEHASRKRPPMRTVSVAYLWMECGVGQSKRLLLVERSPEQTVMPGMWELPAAETTEDEPLLRLRHAIMQVNYQVAIHTGKAPSESVQQSLWVTAAEANTLPLTGLTRKVMRRMGWLAERG